MGAEGAPQPGGKLPDAELAIRVKAGSPDAFRELVLRFQRPVMSVILRMVRDPELAEDLAQEVFLKAYRHMKSYDAERKLSSWLFKIAHNATLDHLRRKKLDLVPLEAGPDESEDHQERFEDTKAASPDLRVHRGDVASAVEAAIGQLRPEYREIVVLRYQEDMAYQEIAEVTDLPMGTVKTHLHRARKQLMDILRGQGWDPAAAMGRS